MRNGGSREIRTGSRPTNLTDTASGTLLVTFTYGNPAFGASSGGSATSNAIANATAVGTGDAGWFRDKTSGGATLADGIITASGGGGDATMDNVSIVSGQTITVSAILHSQPEKE